MEIKAELKQPYTENERINFVVEQNHKLGYEIRQVETTYEVENEVPYTEIETEEIQVPVLDEEGNPVLDEEGNPTFETQIVEKEVTKYRTETVEKTGYNLEAWGYTEEEKQKQKREHINLLSMTCGDMFEAIILAFGKTKADIRSMIENVEGLTDIERALYLNRFDEALDFYRGYPAVDLIGQMLGISSEQLDKFFEFKDYKYLIPNEPVTEEVTEETDVIPEENSIETDIITEEKSIE